MAEFPHENEDDMLVDEEDEDEDGQLLNLLFPPLPVPFKTHNEVWEVINCFFEEKGLVMQQIDSFNHFVDFQIQEIVDDTAEIVIKTQPQFEPHGEVLPPNTYHIT